MLSKKERLSGSDVLRVLRKGKRANFGGLKIVALSPALASQASVVVSARVSKKATQRNVIRRKVYHIISPILPDLKTPAQLVIYLYWDCSKTPQEEIKQSIIQCLKKLSLN
jgi:ribonuclease P protein component